MNRKIFGFALSATLLALCVSAEAQEPKKIPQIGYQSGGSASAATPRIDAFRQGLRELGYTEGQNVVI
jgi:putative ABC transport system substrate-binding protein